MGQPMEVGAWGEFDGDTAIKYALCPGGGVELELGGPGGFNLLVTDAGLTRLAEVVDVARKDVRRLALLDGDEGAR